MIALAILGAVLIAGGTAIAISKSKLATNPQRVQSTQTGGGFLNTVDRVFTDVDKGVTIGKGVKDLLGLGGPSATTTTTTAIDSAGAAAGAAGGLFGPLGAIGANAGIAGAASAEGNGGDWTGLKAGSSSPADEDTANFNLNCDLCGG